MERFYIDFETDFHQFEDLIKSIIQKNISLHAIQ